MITPKVLCKLDSRAKNQVAFEGGVDKMVTKIISTPNLKNLRTSEAAQVLEHIGYQFNRQKGSHQQFVNAVGDVFTLSGHGSGAQIKPCYIKQIRDLVLGCQEGLGKMINRSV